VNLAAVWLQHKQQAAELSVADLHLMHDVGDLTTGWGNDFLAQLLNKQKSVQQSSWHLCSIMLVLPLNAVACSTAAEQAKIHATIIVAFTQHYAGFTTQRCSL
jgi:hypothetical protein